MPTCRYISTRQRTSLPRSTTPSDPQPLSHPSCIHLHTATLHNQRGPVRSRPLMRTHDKPGQHNVEAPTAARTYPSPNSPSPNTTSSTILPQLASPVFQSHCRSIDRNIFTTVIPVPSNHRSTTLGARAYLIQVSLKGYSAKTSAFLPFHSRRVPTIRYATPPPTAHYQQRRASSSPTDNRSLAPQSSCLPQQTILLACSS